MEIRRRTRALCTALIRSASSVGVSEPMRADFACMPSELPLVANQAPSRRRPMINRRTFTALLAGTVAAPNRAWSQHVTAKTVFYASTGPELTVFDVDAGDAALQKRSAVTLPARPIHTSVDRSGEYLLTAYNDPSNVTVHRINGDGSIGEPISQPDKLDAGIYGHQIRTTPGNQTAILIARGNNAAGGKPEDPGALKLFGFKRGALTNLASIAPGTGLGFGPRHLDFHPSQPWVYVSIERQNKLYTYKLQS